ncbi:SET and MYND domain-containing protein 5 [Rhopalosiphum maidis]|uniref:SET and MYND domain-containing protein 5 n=1 Tax=Rhopalosiphum maidis TaxID=43146 RepID=UPI000EFFC67B|nr:SET and MYND domain-containing protein 5 [Rhopalosiphum maidis]
MDTDDKGYIITYDPVKGKCLVATKHFKEDDLIFTEEPFVSCQFSWNSVYGYRACNHCLCPLETTSENITRLTNAAITKIPFEEYCPIKDKIQNYVQCQSCKVWYCSSTCLETAYNRYHQLLCRPDSSDPLHCLEELWRTMHYPPESHNIMLLCRLLATIELSASPQQANQTVSNFCHRTENENEHLVHKMLGEKFVEQIEQLRFGVLKSIPVRESSQWLTPTGFKSLLALIGTNGQGVGTSVFHQWTNNCKKHLSSNQLELFEQFIDNTYEAMEQVVGVDFLDNEGSALFQEHSSINHSCFPNAASVFDGNHVLRLVAIRMIEPGDEINTSYIAPCELDHSRHTRQKYLQENYVFTCRCIKCEEQINEPDVTSDDDSEMEDDYST